MATAGPEAVPTPPGPDRWPVWGGPVAFLLAIIATTVLGGVLAAAVAFAGGSTKDSPTFTIAGTVIQDAALVGAAVLLALRYGPVRAADFGLRPIPLREGALWTLGAVVAFYTTSGVYALLVRPESEQDLVEVLGTEDGTGYLLATAALVILVAPITEEVFFRGFFYRSLRNRLPPLGAAVVVGVVFGAIHYRGSDTVDLLPVLAILGVLFCLLYERTDSLYPAIALHVVNNTIALMAASDANFTVPVAVAFGSLALGACVAVPARARRTA